MQHQLNHQPIRGGRGGGGGQNGPVPSHPHVKLKMQHKKYHYGLHLHKNMKMKDPTLESILNTTCKICACSLRMIACIILYIHTYLTASAFLINTAKSRLENLVVDVHVRKDGSDS